MRYVSVNLRPTDMEALYDSVLKMLQELPDFRGLVAKVGIEVTEDEAHPSNMRDMLASWKKLGFQIIIDDIISTKLGAILGGNFHTVDKILPILDYVDRVKVDM